MSKLFFLFTAITVISACSNQQPAETTAPEQKDTVAVNNIAPANDTLIKTPSAFIDTLSADEMKDDTVFSDGSQPTSWANAGFDHPIAFKQFLKKLQYWVASNQRDSVANCITFPLKHPPLQNKAAFMAQYDSLFNDNVKKALQSQHLRQIFRRDQGAMIGDGQLWFSETKKGFRIISINNKTI